MKTCETEIIQLKRLKKDGDLPETVAEEVLKTLLEGGSVVLPVDYIYGIVSLNEKIVEKAVSKSKCIPTDIVALVSSYKMLDELVMYSKADYDFLNRIWPGEISVYMRSVKDEGHTKRKIRFPKSKFLLGILSKAEKIFYYAPVMHAPTESIYKKKSIITTFKNIVDKILIIEEFCKKHPLPSVIDISNNTLEIIHAGRIPTDEIKSLYFLDKSE
ncbi:MAG: Sua5/YciO/YrdC/YwlC family protein [Spirochaetes bacterium]|nr:Sua5/YciO/YrdC/YwlC family protein [Spirochaetota bacterium]